jgi:hypothetical protein
MKLGITSILKRRYLNPAPTGEPPSSSYIARTASHTLIPTAFHPNHDYHLTSRTLRHLTSLNNMASDIDIYVVSCGHVLLFALSIFHHNDLDFPDHNSNYTVRLD